MRLSVIAVIIFTTRPGAPVSLERSPRWSHFWGLEDLCTEKCQATGKPLGRLLGFTCSCYCPVLDPPPDNDPCDDSVGPSCQRFCQKRGYQGGACPYNDICLCFCTLFDRYRVPNEETTTTEPSTTTDPSTTIDIGQFDPAETTTEDGTSTTSTIPPDNPETTTEMSTLDPADEFIWTSTQGVSSTTSQTENGASTTPFADCEFENSIDCENAPNVESTVKTTPANIYAHQAENETSNSVISDEDSLAQMNSAKNNFTLYNENVSPNYRETDASLLKPSLPRRNNNSILYSSVSPSELFRNPFLNTANTSSLYLVMGNATSANSSSSMTNVTAPVNKATVVSKASSLKPLHNKLHGIKPEKPLDASGSKWSWPWSLVM